MKKVYLDYAAATPLDQDVLELMLPYLNSDFYNPSALYLDARRTKQALEAARTKTAQTIGAKPAEIIFTAGATEANNLAIQGVLRQYPNGEIIVPAIEHESVLAPAGLFKRKIAPVDAQGVVDLDKLEKLISDKTCLVSIGLANNEIGTLQPLKEIATLIKKVRAKRTLDGLKTPIYLHTDAAQAPCYLDIHVSRLGADLMSINGGKIYGPKQSGFLYIKAGVKLAPLILGGGQESGLRSGTQNVGNCVGLAGALQKAVQLRASEAKRVLELRIQFVAGALTLAGAQVNGSFKHTAPHIVNVRFGTIDNERLMMELDEAGVQIALGSACSASSQEPSHVLQAIGLSPGQARSSLRFSFGRQTSTQDISHALKVLRAKLSNR